MLHQPASGSQHICTKLRKPYAVDDDEYRAARAWREVLEYKGLPLDTPYRYKTYSDRIAGSRFSYLKSYCDRLYKDLRAKKGNLEASSSSAAKICMEKRRQLDAEALRKQKLRKPKRYKRYTDLVYADEDSKKKRDNKIKAHKEMNMQIFKKNHQKRNGLNSFFY
ncbi:hypothetical protein Tco_1130086 [Tanacetum coccineum]